MKLSVIIPVYNSERSLPSLVTRLKQALDHLPFEIVMVNDGSSDNSEEIGKILCREFPFVKFLSLRKNFGEFNAVMCGLNWAQGEFCVVIDDDFQNPPEEIEKLIREAERGNHDVVYTFYHSCPK